MRVHAQSVGASWILHAVAVAVALVVPACGGSSPSVPTPFGPTPSSGPAPAASVGAAVSAMLPDLEAEIANAIQSNESLVPRNPRLEAILRARIALLQDPALPARIRNEKYYVFCARLFP